MRSIDFKWSDTGYVLVCCTSREACTDFAAEYLRRNADTAGGVADFISGYRKGFLQKEPTISELLVSQRPRKERAEFQKRMEQHLAELGLEMYKYRRPKSIGGEALRCWSCLYAALTGAKKFLLMDFGTPESIQTTARLAKWLQNVCDECSIVWVSATDDETVLCQEIFPYCGSHLYRCRDMWRLEGDRLTAIDRDALRARHEAAVAAEIRRREEALEAEKRRKAEAQAAEFARQQAEAKRLWESREYWPMLDVCNKLIPQGSREACLYAYAAWASEGVDNGIKSYAARLLYECNQPDLLIRMGKKYMEYVEQHMDEAKTDEKMKTLVITQLLDARDAFKTAAELGSADACYEAAKLHLRYQCSFSSYSFSIDLRKSVWPDLLR